MGPQRFWRVMDAEFPSFYMTMASVIQGAAFAVLVTKGAELARSGAYVTLGALGANFLVVVFVWQQNLYASSSNRYGLLLSDATVPFLIGLVQCIAILTVDEPRAYLLSAAALAVVGIVDAVRIRRLLVVEAFESQELYQLEVDDFWQTATVYSVAVVTFTCGAILAGVVDAGWARAMSYLPLGFMVLVFVWSEMTSRRWLRHMAEHHEPRSDP